MNKKALPKFASEEEERVFWADNDSTDYVDWSNAQHVLFPNLKPSRRTISIRMPESLLAQLKVMAHKRDVPYQSLIKIILHQAVESELQGSLSLNNVESKPVKQTVAASM